MKNLELANASILHKNGVKIAICTDHPEVPIQYLPLSASLAVKGGLPREIALKALTSEPADMLGVADKIGRIAVCLDADLVLFKDDPLNIMNDPSWVMINGKII